MRCLSGADGVLDICGSDAEEYSRSLERIRTPSHVVKG